jgi:AraC-like DNA-binding protein
MTSTANVFMNRCQVLAGRFCESAPGDLLPELRGLVEGLPPTAAPSEQLVIGGAVTRILAHLSRLARIDTRADVARAFIGLADAGAEFDRWRQEWVRVADVCATAIIRDSSHRSAQHLDSRVASMLRVIDDRYADCVLTVRIVAKAADVSPWHARLLKQQTGAGFVEHLHRRRTTAARQLLLDTPLSVKQVATAVGYNHQSQLTRHFKRICGVTPVAFRRTHAATIESA